MLCLQIFLFVLHLMAFRNKWCFVPCCTNTSIKTPNKVFVCVPREYSRKVTWFKAARREMPKSQSIFFCCEDHFDLKEDMENYMRYRLVGGNIKLRNNVIPHKFDCQKDERRVASALEKEKKRLVEEAFSLSATVTDINKSGLVDPLDISIVSSKLFEQSIQTAIEEDPIVSSTGSCTRKYSIPCRSIGVQVRPYYRSKCTMYDFMTIAEYTASLPTKTTMQNEGTSSVKKPTSRTKLKTIELSMSSS